MGREKIAGWEGLVPYLGGADQIELRVIGTIGVVK